MLNVMQSRKVFHFITFFYLYIYLQFLNNIIRNLKIINIFYFESVNFIVLILLYVPFLFFLLQELNLLKNVYLEIFLITLL